MKKTIAVIFGGKSGEHEVSVASAISVYHALDKSKYDVLLIGINKQGRWTAPERSLVLAHERNPRLLNLNRETQSVALVPFASDRQLVPMGGGAGLPTIDAVIPILHGPNGEDGTIQGLLELSQIPYVGSGVLGSALGMDKDVSRRLLRADGIPVVPTIVARRADRDQTKIVEDAIERFGFPFFVKPANMGSSVGVSKAKSAAEARAAIDGAFAYDDKILIERAIDARELECAVLGDLEPRASVVGELVPSGEFYDYDAKYVDENGASFSIPAEDLPAGAAEQIRDLSLRAFRTLECSGLARVDFFLDRRTGEIYLNEINTIPGFTKISMYPKLWEASGLPYGKLLDELIQLAIDRRARRSALRTSYGAKE